ncbi:LysM peptidoglycan-binding domain-containing protein [Peribacillus glennii]|uniref:LysM peptidoglycan-binding domain-containing protein n=1 Tax=Peribacillus glennii TaxID=2303991 RepID=A0A372LIB6_9BACI|nr:LysM domain-containing protein [Peribacillus glennii]RFU65722.1 LysM peptidoglycan-binding domain-containing protein [Peribacillus glennii]
MKRLLLFLTACFFGFIVYFDLTTGTLPAMGIVAVEKAKEYPRQTIKEVLPYKQITVKPGDTLLTIVEREEGSLQVAIETVVADFQKLNKGLRPQDMQIGETYKIPVYE